MAPLSALHVRPSGGMDSSCALRSLLSDEGARYSPCGPVGCLCRWYLVEEADGTTYVLSARWIAAASGTSLPELQRRQMLIDAAYWRRKRRVVVFVGDEDRAEFSRRGLAESILRPEFWAVAG